MDYCKAIYFWSDWKACCMTFSESRQPKSLSLKPAAVYGRVRTFYGGRWLILRQNSFLILILFSFFAISNNSLQNILFRIFLTLREVFLRYSLGVTLRGTLPNTLRDILPSTLRGTLRDTLRGTLSGTLSSTLSNTYDG